MTLAYTLDIPSRDDPYPIYRRLRDQDPAHYSAAEDIWVLTRFDDVNEAFSDAATWSSRRRGNLLNDIPERLGKTLGTTDPSEHTFARGVVSRAFTPRTVVGLESKIREFARRLAEDARARGTIEFTNDISAPFNASTLGAMFGLPEEEFLQLRGWLDDFFLREEAAPGEEPVQVVAMRELRRYIDGVVEARRADPGDDLLSAMLSAEQAGRRLSSEQVAVTTMTFLTAGFESTNNLFTNLAAALARHPALWHTLRADPAGIPDFVEEGARWDAAAQGFVRTPTRDVPLHGVTIPEGAQVLLHIGAANRDERRFPEPDQFLLDRPERRHLGFGQGIHFCVGAGLARAMTRIAFEELIAHSDRWDVDFTTAQRVRTPNFRGFSRLPLTLV